MLAPSSKDHGNDYQSGAPSPRGVSAKDIIEQCHQNLLQAKRVFSRQWVKQHMKKYEIDDVLTYSKKTSQPSSRPQEKKSPRLNTKNFREINKQRIAKLSEQRKEREQRAAADSPGHLPRYKSTLNKLEVAKLVPAAPKL
jgi:wobble nucleotide-excising tRNase